MKASFYPENDVLKAKNVKFQKENAFMQILSSDLEAALNFDSEETL